MKMRELSDVFVALCSGVSIGKVGGELSIIVMVQEPRDFAILSLAMVSVQSEG